MSGGEGPSHGGEGRADGFVTAVGFLTVLGRAGTPSARSMSWFPIVGTGIGAVVGTVWWAGEEIWSPALAAIVAITVDVALTGALHHDGLADSADGLLPHMDRTRRLVVMRGPDVGAFGVAAVVLVVLLQVGALAAIEPHPALLAALWCASRTTMAVAARTVPYARSEGLASAFLGGSPVAVGLVGLAVSLPLAAWAHRGLGAVAIAAVVVGGLAVVELGRRRLGGFTGDVLGAAGLVGQSLGLLVAAVDW